MSRRNSRAAKDARNLRTTADLARRSQARTSAPDLLEEKLRNKVREIANEYNAKLLSSSLNELKDAYIKRLREGEMLHDIKPSRVSREQLIEILTLTVEDEDQTIDKEKET